MRIWIDLRQRNSITKKLTEGMKIFLRLMKIHPKNLRLGIMTGIDLADIHGKYAGEVIRHT